MIDAEDDTDLFGTFEFFVLDLSSCLEYVVGGFSFGFFFFVKINFVVGITEFAFPDALFVSFSSLGFFSFTVAVEYSLAFLADYWITSSNLCFVS